MSARTVTGEEKWYATKTDENGDYHFDLPDGEYLIEGIWIDTQSKWYPKVISFTVKDGVLLNQSTVVIDLTLEPAVNVNGAEKVSLFIGIQLNRS